MAEQNNTLLMKNHETRPTRSAPFSEVNVVATHNQFESRKNNVVVVIVVVAMDEDVVENEIIIVIMVEIDMRITNFLKTILLGEESIFITNVT